MSSEWQSWTTLGIIILTLTIFIGRSIAKHRKKGGCGSDCACPSSSLPKKKDPES